MFENGSSAVGRWACGEDSDVRGGGARPYGSCPILLSVVTLVSLVVSVTGAIDDEGGDDDAGGGTDAVGSGLRSKKTARSWTGSPRSAFAALPSASAADLSCRA